MSDYDYNDDFEYQEFKENMDKQSKHFQRWQGEQQQKYSNQVYNDLWNEALKEEGLDPQAYGNIASQDPEHVKAELKKSMKTLIGNVKKGRDAKGRFVSQSEGKAEVQHQRAQEAQGKLDHYAEISKKRTLTDDEGMDVLDALFGGPLY